MSTAPAAKSVARSRYWLAAAFRLTGTLMGLWSAATVSKAAIYLVLYVIEDTANGGSATFGQRLTSFWISGGSDVLWFVGSVVLFFKAAAIAGIVFPTVGIHCAKCGYSRRGLVTNTPCPECGARPEAQNA